MQYKVKHDTSMTAEERQHNIDLINELNRDCGLPEDHNIYFPEVGEYTILAPDRTHMEKILADEYGVTADKILEVTVLLDDSNELIRDLDIIALADEEPCCANYDWTQDQVLSFARKLIAKYQEAQQLK